MVDFETYERLLAQAKNYKEYELDLFIAEVGWQDWMNNFTEAKEDEVISEKESEYINQILIKIFKEAHS